MTEIPNDRLVTLYAKLKDWDCGMDGHAVKHVTIDDVDLLADFYLKHRAFEGAARILAEDTARLTAEVDSRIADYERAYQYALKFGDDLNRKHFPNAPDWCPLGDLLGLLVQINMMVSRLSLAPKPEVASETAALQFVLSGREVMRFKADGTVSFAPDLRPEEAAKEAWAILQSMAVTKTDSMVQVKHVKRGTTYRVVGGGKLQTDMLLGDMAEVIIYQSDDDGHFWVRRASEFWDGRFIPLTANPIDGSPEPDPVIKAAKALLDGRYTVDHTSPDVEKAINLIGILEDGNDAAADKFAAVMNMLVEPIPEERPE